MEDSYVKMMERMNQNDAKHAVTEGMLTILRVLYTEEQAALIGDFPLGSYTSRELAGILQREEKPLDEMLQNMAAKARIFVASRENGDKEYSVLPFEPGLLELQFLKGKDDDEQRNMLKLHDKMHEEEAVIFAELLKYPEAVRERFANQIGRIVGIEEIVSADKQVVPWEKLSSIIEGSNSYAVGECGCKHIKRLQGDPCKSGVSSKCCVWLNKTADYLAERGYATRLTKEEAYALFKTCEDAGLIHFTSNLSDAEPVVVCNCCKCCCIMLNKDRQIRMAGIEYGITASSNFIACVDEETCVGCGECVDFCQMRALQLIDDKLTVDPLFCLGCGVCVAKCPTGSMSLTRISAHAGRKATSPVVGRPGV